MKLTQGVSGYWTLGACNTATTGTLAFHIKITGFTNGSTMSFYNGNPASNGWGLYIEANSQSVRTIFAGVASGSRATVLSNGVWAHVAMTRNGTSYRLYRDGVHVGGGPETRSAITPTGTFWIGYSAHTTPPAVEYCDVCYYDSELSLDRIYMLAVGLSPLKVNPRPTRYWPFIRALHELVGGVDATAFGTTSVGDNPPLYK